MEFTPHKDGSSRAIERIVLHRMHGLITAFVDFPSTTDGMGLGHAPGF
jgi:hypothetical protein